MKQLINQLPSFISPFQPYSFLSGNKGKSLKHLSLTSVLNSVKYVNSNKCKISDSNFTDSIFTLLVFGLL